MEHFIFQRVRTLAAAALMMLASHALVAAPAGTAISYQGRLADGATAADGEFEFRFTLHDAVTGGVQVGSTLTNGPVAVAQGIFTTSLDFGVGVFEGSSRWLEIGIRPAGSAVPFTGLTPRQALLAVPYAHHALNGTPGPAGPVGPKGEAGTAGPSGPQGATGPVGPKGDKGDPGDVGTAGPTGPKGEVGAVGPIGPQGLTGATGPKGDKGDKGDPGAAGVAGPVGPQGLVGPTGPKGDPGTTGPKGDVGAVGPAGPLGLTGATGPKGDKGDKGDPGAAGVAGPVGPQGLVGPSGATGPQGLPGTTGPIGPVGVAGPRGPAGATGPAGAVGPQGPAGPQGLPGSSDAWSRTGNLGTSPGVNFIGTTDNQPFEIRANNLRSLRLQPGGLGPSLIAGSPANFVPSGVSGATISGGGSGGLSNVVTEVFGVIGGGRGNRVSAVDATVGGGFQNLAEGGVSVVGGGQNNKALDSNSTVAGGAFNTSSNWNSTVGGGNGNAALGNESTVGGGSSNTASGGASTIPGGTRNTAEGYASFAAGNFAHAAHRGSFVWSDGPLPDNQPFFSTAPNQFLAKASGGAVIGTGANDPQGHMLRVEGSVKADNGLVVGTSAGTLSITGGQFTPELTIDSGPVPGVLRVRNSLEIWPSLGGFRSGALDVRNSLGEQTIILEGGGGTLTARTVNAVTINPTSDRNAKENFAAVDPQEVLAKVAALPITRWNFKADTQADHVGPMAQDFREAFGLGTDDRHIATVDADGVALAAIQGLHRKVEAENAALRDRNAALEARLARLEQLLAVPDNGGGR